MSGVEFQALHSAMNIQNPAESLGLQADVTAGSFTLSAAQEGSLVVIN